MTIEISKYIPTGRPCGRATHAWLGDDRSTLDLFTTGFTLLQFTTKTDGQALFCVQSVPITLV